MFLRKREKSETAVEYPVDYHALDAVDSGGERNSGKDVVGNSMTESEISLASDQNQY